MGTLSGKVALVTGGSRGIGAAIARSLADAGANVAISYGAQGAKAEAVVKELRAKGVQAEAFEADQADAQQVARLVERVRERFKGLDILVNNAGVFRTGAVDDHAADWKALDHQFAVNVGGVIAAIRAAARVLPKGGRIITIGSGLGTQVPFPGVPDYASTKAALVGYTKGAARDLGPKSITINLVQPGPIDTDMNPDQGDFATTLKKMTPLGRYGKPEEVAAAVTFLAGPGASYITGAILNVDGGLGA